MLHLVGGEGGRRRQGKEHESKEKTLSGPRRARSSLRCPHGTKPGHTTTICGRPNLGSARNNPKTNDAAPTTCPRTQRENCVSNYLAGASPRSEPPKSPYSPRMHPPARPPVGVPEATLARFVGFDRYLRAPRQGFGLRPRLRPSRRAVPRPTSAVWSKTRRRPILPLAAPIKIGPSVSWTVPMSNPLQNCETRSAPAPSSRFRYFPTPLRLCRPQPARAAQRNSSCRWARVKNFSGNRKFVRRL